MKILSIGNSFSQDAQRYLHKIAEKNGRRLKNCNLYIGGCTLRKHYFNIIDDEKAYEFQFNGEETVNTENTKRVIFKVSTSYQKTLLFFI